MKATNTIVIFIDTLRAGNTGLYGGSWNTTPFLDHLGSNSTVFEHALCHRSGSWMSYTTFFRGTDRFGFSLRDAAKFEEYFRENHTYRTEYQKTPRSQTLPGVLNEERIPTRGVISGSMLDPEWGWDTGFDEYHNSIHTPLQRQALQSRVSSEVYRYASVAERKAHQYIRVANNIDSPKLPSYGYRRAELTTDVVINQLDEFKDSGGFFFIQYTDPHAPNYPYTGAPNDWSFYDQDIRRVDDEIKRLFTALGTRDLLEETLMIITADHGESFPSEHNAPRRDHGLNVYEESIRIPLIISHPDLPAQRIDDGIARIKDLPATIIDAFGIAEPDTFTGESLLPVITSKSQPPQEALIVEQGEHMVRNNTETNVDQERVGPVIALRRPTAKYVTTPALDEPIEWYYQLGKDPQEKVNQASIINTSEEQDRVGEITKEWKELGTEEGLQPTESLEPGMKEQLRDLGYM